MNSCNCGYYPTVIVPGIGQSKVDMYSPDGERTGCVWPLKINEKELMKRIAPSALKMLVTRKDGKFISVLKEEVREIIYPLSLNNEGVPKNDLRPVDYRGRSVAECSEDEKRYIYKMVPMQSLSGVIGEDHLFFFSYNSFGQPYETAQRLNEYIQNVKSLTGHNKVNLVPVSLGASIATAYFDAYGKLGDIHRVCYFVPAADGSSVISDVFSGNMDFSDVNSLFEMLLGAGTAKKLSPFFEKLPEGTLEKTLDAVIGVVLEELLLNCPGMWAVVPKRLFPELSEKYLSGNSKAVLKAKAERFYKAQSRLRELIEEQKSMGVKFFAICGYGLPLPAFCGSKKINSDSVVDFTSASLGGTAAPVGEKLTEEITASMENCCCEEHNHRSPDGTVDLSTSVLPDSTFCFKGQVHDDAGKNTAAITLCKEILTNESFCDIFSDERFPQFGDCSFK